MSDYWEKLKSSNEIVISHLNITIEVQLLLIRAHNFSEDMKKVLLS